MFFIRQGATQKVVIGPAVDIADGLTAITNLAISSSDEAEVILHDNARQGIDNTRRLYTWRKPTTAAKRTSP